MPKRKNLANMTDKELDAEAYRLDDEATLAREAKLEVQRERDRRAAEAKFSGLSDAEKAAFTQIIEAEGIESKEEVGEPGKEN